MIRFFLLFILFSFNNIIFAQIRLTGKVTDVEKQPLAGVMVKVTNGNATLGFATTGKDGNYECAISDSKIKMLIVSFRKLNHKDHLDTVTSGTKRLDVTLHRGAIQLREAVVRVPPVKALGDTVLYNLKSFLQSGDHTLEDGLKRLPGIKVDDTGGISYMGRDISNFYIEGLNLLGGRYNLATQNIPTDKVTSVEVLRHHQANKVDKQELSDHVALNIKLSAKARLRPFGTYEARLGYRPDKWLYGAGGTGMLFRKNFQMLGTLKLANDGRMGRNELYDHFSVSSWNTSAEAALPLLSGNRPPMREIRYFDSSNAMFSINALQKLTDDNQLRVNANYSHRHSKHDYHVLTQYPDDDAYLLTEELADFRQREHRADVNLNYRSDKETRLVENTFAMRGRFADALSDADCNKTPYSSQQTTNTFGLRNDFSLVRRINKWKMNFGSTVQYTETPDNTLDISRYEEDYRGIIRQETRSRTFYTKETFYTGFQLQPSLTLSLPVALNANVNRLHTDWRGDTLAVNALQGWNMSLSATPQIEYQTANRGFRATIGVPLTFFTQDYRNKARGADLDFAKCYANWAVKLIYVPNGNVEWNASSYLHQNFGDMADLLTGPIQTDYRTIRTRSGIFGRSKLIRNNLSFDWQEPLTFWHFTAHTGYNRSISNIMNGQQVTGGNQSFQEVVHDNTGDVVSTSASLSKFLFPIKTSMSVEGAYRWQRFESVSQQNIVTTYSSGYTLSGHISTNPVSKFQAFYDLTFQRYMLRGHNAKSSSDNWKQQARATYTFRPGFLASLSGELQRNSLPASGRKSFAFLDAAMEYKFSNPKLHLRLELNNLLNTRTYSHTVYDALNTYVYNYRLNGREFLLTIVLH